MESRTSLCLPSTLGPRVNMAEDILADGHLVYEGTALGRK